MIKVASKLSIALACILFFIHAHSNESTQDSLLGNWFCVSGNCFDPEINFQVYEGENVFSSWLHSRPSASGSWSIKGRILSIECCSSLKLEWSIKKITDSTLVLRESGNNEDIVFRNTPVKGYIGLSHCRTGEKLIFNCRMSENDKTLSVCASEIFSRDDGYIQYRYGNLSNVELQFPKDRVNSSEKFLWQSYTYSGGWDTRIQFSIGSYKYQVFDQAYKDTNITNKYSGGVFVFKNKKKIVSLNCESDTLNGKGFHSLNELFEKVPRGDFFVDIEDAP